MPVLMVRSKIKPEHAADAEAAIKKVFSAIEQAQPAGVRYASSRLADGTSFVVLFEAEDGWTIPLWRCPRSWSFRRTSSSGWPSRRPWSR